MVLGILIGLLSATSFSLSGMLQHNFVQNKRATDTVVYIFLLMVLFFLPVLFFVYTPLTSYQSWLIFFTSIFGFFAFYSLVKSYQKLGVNQALAIAFGYPILLLLIEFFGYRNPLSVFETVGCLLAVAGTYLFLSPHKTKDVPLKYYGFAGITLIGWTFYYWSLDALSKTGLNSLQVIGFVETATGIFGLLFLFIVSRFTKRVFLAKYEKKQYLIISVAVFCQALAGYLYVVGLNYVSFAVIGALGGFQLLVTAVVEHFFLKKRMGTSQWIGLFVFVSSIVLLSLF